MSLELFAKIRNQLTESDFYHSVFSKEKADGKWSHYADHDNLPDAKDDQGGLKRRGAHKAITLRVPKKEANWVKNDPHEYVTSRLKEELEILEAKMSRKDLVNKGLRDNRGNRALFGRAFRKGPTGEQELALNPVLKSMHRNWEKNPGRKPASTKEETEPLGIEITGKHGVWGAGKAIPGQVSFLDGEIFMDMMFDHGIERSVPLGAVTLDEIRIDEVQGRNKADGSRPDDTSPGSHIVAQLRRVMSLRNDPPPVAFKNGKSEHVNPNHAARALAMHDNMKSSEKLRFVSVIGHSHDALKTSVGAGTH